MYHTPSWKHFGATYFFFLVDQEDFYLVIHNIDGVMLRNDKAQTILSLMAKIRGFHIVASLDHINAPLCKYNIHRLDHFTTV